MSSSVQVGSFVSRSSILDVNSITTLLLLIALTANFLFASSHDFQRCAEIVALCGMVTVLLARIARGRALNVPVSSSILLMVFFALGVASVATAHSLRHAVYEWSSLLLLIALVFTLATELSRDVARLPSLISCVGIACGLYSLRVLIMYFVALATGFQLDFFDLIVGFSNPRFFNHTQTALLPLIVLLCLKAADTGQWRNAWFALAAFWWSLLFITEARSSVLSLGISCACVFTLRRSHARPFLVMMAKTALAGIALYVALFILLPTLAGMQPIGSPSSILARTVANPASDRFLLWKLAIDLIVAHPWLGVGPQHFAHEGATLYAGAHPHNWLLQIAVEWGILALLCLLGVVGLAARALVRISARIAEADRANQTMLVTLQVTCTAIFLDGLLSGVIVMPQSQLAIALILGIACAWVRQQDGKLQNLPPVCSALNRAVLFAAVAAGLCGLIWSVAPDFVRHARGDVLTPVELSVNWKNHASRMWEAGYF